MMSFQEFFNETARGEKQSKDNRIFFNGINPDRKNVNIVPDVNKVSGNKMEEIINDIKSGPTTSKVVSPDLLRHIQTTYGVDTSKLVVPKTLGNSNVEIYSVRGSNGQPIMMLRRKS